LHPKTTSLSHVIQPLHCAVHHLVSILASTIATDAALSHCVYIFHLPAKYLLCSIGFYAVCDLSGMQMIILI